MTTSALPAAGRSRPVDFAASSLIDADPFPEHLRLLASGAPRLDAGRGTRGAAWPCAELHRCTRSLAAGLQALGVRRGDVVAVVSGVRPQVLEAWLATVELGAIFNLVNPDLAGQELVDVIADAGAATVIADANALSALLDHRLSFAGAIRLVGFDVPADDDGPVLGFDALRLSVEPQTSRTAPQAPGAPADTCRATVESEGATLNHRDYLPNSVLGAEILSLRREDRYGLLLPLVLANAQIVCALVLRLIRGSVAPSEIDRVRLRTADSPSGATELRG